MEGRSVGYGGSSSAQSCCGDAGQGEGMSVCELGATHEKGRKVDNAPSPGLDAAPLPGPPTPPLRIRNCSPPQQLPGELQMTKFPTMISTLPTRSLIRSVRALTKTCRELYRNPKGTPKDFVPKLCRSVGLVIAMFLEAFGDHLGRSASPSHRKR